MTEGTVEVLGALERLHLRYPSRHAFQRDEMTLYLRETTNPTSALTALLKRGFVKRASRDNGLPGIAFYITPAGAEAIDVHYTRLGWTNR